MIIQIRTKDDLSKLLEDEISYSWRVSNWRIGVISGVEIYNFDGSEKIAAKFDKERTLILENGKVAIAFKEGYKELCSYNWKGQNPIKYISATIENQSILSESTKPFNEIINSSLYNKISDFFEVKDTSDFEILKKADIIEVKYIGKTADPNSKMNLFIYSDHCEFEFMNGQSLSISLDYDNAELDEWLGLDGEYGTMLARQFNLKYNEEFEERINSDSDTSFDEDFQIYFIGEFVNFILNETAYED